MDEQPTSDHRDKFSHRIEQGNNDAMGAQLSMSIEEVLRRKNGHVIVWTDIRTLGDMPDASVALLPTLMAKVANELGVSPPLVGYDQGQPKHILLGTTNHPQEPWMLFIECSYQTSYSSGDDFGTLHEFVSSQQHLTSCSEGTRDRVLRALDDAGLKVSVSNRRENVSVSFAFPGSHGLQFESREFGVLPLESIVQNYTPDVLVKVKDAIAAIKRTEHGLVLLSGPVGTGKTYLLRSMLTELRERQATICSPPTQFLSNIGMLIQAANQAKKSVLVLEDIGDILAIDGGMTHEDSTSNLLNLTEGLLSLLTDTVVVVSFNHDLGKIRPAFTRAGRCIAQIEVGTLPCEQVEGLVGFAVPKRKEGYALSDVYEMLRTGVAAAKLLAPSSGFGFSR